MSLHKVLELYYRVSHCVPSELVVSLVLKKKKSREILHSVSASWFLLSLQHSNCTPKAPFMVTFHSFSLFVVSDRV